MRCLQDQNADQPGGSPGSTSSTQRGFSLLEVVIAVALLAITAAVIIPAVAAVESRSRAVRVRGEFEGIRVGFDRARQASSRFPAYVSQITEKPIDNDPSNCTDAKNLTWPTQQTGLWHSNKNLFGPFFRRRLSRRASTTGFIAADGWGTVSDIIGKVSSTLFFLTVSNVSEMDIAELDALVDASNGAAAGTVRWTGPVEGYVTVEYRMQSALAAC